MRQDDFENMIRRMEQEVPAEFLSGVAEVAVSPRTVPHPTRDEIFTLGECIPLPDMDGAAEGIQSRVVLYYGSFQALARIAPGFDWRAGAGGTLTPQRPHHPQRRGPGAGPPSPPPPGGGNIPPPGGGGRGPR